MVRFGTRKWFGVMLVAWTIGVVACYGAYGTLSIEPTYDAATDVSTEGAPTDAAGASDIADVLDAGVADGSTLDVAPTTIFSDSFEGALACNGWLLQSGSAINEPVARTGAQSCRFCPAMTFSRM